MASIVVDAVLRYSSPQCQCLRENIPCHTLEHHVTANTLYDLSMYGKSYDLDDECVLGVAYKHDIHRTQRFYIWNARIAERCLHEDTYLHMSM